MEMTVEKFETTMVNDGKGHYVAGAERKVGKTQVVEFGGFDDHISAAVGGTYTCQWNPDFLQLSRLGKNCPFARFYYDKKFAVDIDDPKSRTADKKRRLLFENGFGYLCIPPDFPQDYEQVKSLYLAALAQYQAYEKLHPRPDMYQEMTLPPEGNLPARVVRVRAIDTKVGGGLNIDPGAQVAEINKAVSTPLTGTELELAKENARIAKAALECARKGQPFRNPFIKKGGVRLYKINYGSSAQ